MAPHHHRVARVVEAATEPSSDVFFVWVPDGGPSNNLTAETFSGLTRSGRPVHRTGATEPWAVVVADRSSTAAAVSPSFSGGLFWARTASGLVFSDNLRDLVDRLAGGLTLDADFIRSFALLAHDTSGTRTAFDEIHRVEPGTTAIWERTGSRPDAPAQHPTHAAHPRTVEWCGPESWPDPYLEGPDTPERYLDTFDAAVDELLGIGPIYTQMSGGLDSTFVAASLVRHATPENPVHALCHSPLPESKLAAHGHWDPDDYPIAQAMAATYPGRIVVHRVHAPVHAHPLDAAARAAAVRGVPTFNPGNQIWITHVAELAATAGATRLFSGTNGNPAFSYHHPYATGYHLTRGEPIHAWRSLLTEGAQVPDRAHVRGRVLSPAVGAVRQRLSARGAQGLDHLTRRQNVDYQALIGLDHLGPSPALPTMNRARYLTWLARRGPLHAASMFSGSAVPVVDPFTTGRMLDLAAAITPLEWSRGPGDSRTYARLLGAGRVPDSIRLRTRRGGQAWDEWYLIRNDRDRYFDEASALTSTPILGGWVDERAVRAILEQWPWGQVAGPSRMSVLAMNRIFSLAAYVRAATNWIAKESSRDSRVDL